MPSSRCAIATPLHQPALHYLSEGLMGSADLQKDVEQLQLLVRRVEVDQLDDEDDRQTRPPTILDGLSLKMLLLSGTDDGEASWPRTQFLFEHEGGDIRPTR